jgi:hypothetical protein
MKKPVLYVLVILLAFCSCSTKDDSEFNDSDDSEFDASEMFKEIFENWDCQDVFKSETYHLLETLIDYIDEKLLYPLPSWSSYRHTYYPTVFNDTLQKNKEAVAFFKKEDCVFVLISTYLTAIKTNKYLMIEVPDCTGCDGFIENMWYSYLEWVLSSNMFISKMNATERIQLMVLVLERIKYEKRGAYAFSIPISIMLSSNYTSFVNDVKPKLREVNLCRYGLQSNDNITVPGIDDQTSDLIIGYAKRFIKDNK